MATWPRISTREFVRSVAPGGIKGLVPVTGGFRDVLPSFPPVAGPGMSIAHEGHRHYLNQTQF